MVARISYATSLGLGTGNKQISIHHNSICITEIAHLSRFRRSIGDFGHPDCFKLLFEIRHRIYLLILHHLLHRPLNHLFGAATGREQAHSHFYQSGIELVVRNHFIRVQDKFNTSAERSTKGGCNNWKRLITQPNSYVLEIFCCLLHPLFIPLLPSLYGFHQIRAVGKVIIVVTDDQPVELLFNDIAGISKRLYKLEAQSLFSTSKLKKSNTITHIIQGRTVIAHYFFILSF